MNSSFITVVIIIWILVLFALSLKSKSARSYKNEIVSLGVLGTFIGIAMGLYHFDVSNLKEGMPHLLEGLKTAFITSGVGIFFSIMLSIIKPPLKQNRLETLEALEIVVKEFNTNLIEQFGDNFKELNESVKNMITWQDNYKSMIKSHEDGIIKILSEIKTVSLLKENEQKNIQALIENLKNSSLHVRNSLEDTTSIVKENMQLLLREANGKL
jgi:intein/homing endonuclease